MTSRLEYISKSIPVSMADDWFEIANASHFWMQWRMKALLRYKHLLPPASSRVFEIGCGNGIFMEQLEKHLAYTVDGCDLNMKALDLAQPGKGRLMVYNIFDLNPALIKHYPAVFLMDVIEHIDDDITFLKTATEYLQPQGLVVVNVPAHMYLFSKYDDAAGHVRRYSKESLRTAFIKADIEPLKVFYWGGSLIPLALLRKQVLRHRTEKIIEQGFAPPNALTHTLLKGIMNVETALPLGPLSGTSVMAIGRKR